MLKETQNVKNKCFWYSYLSLRAQLLINLRRLEAAQKSGMSGAIYIHWHMDWNTDRWTTYFSLIVLTATDKMAAVSCLLQLSGPT